METGERWGGKETISSRGKLNSAILERRERGKECLVAEDGGGGHKTHLHWGFFLFYYEDKKHVSEQGRVPSIEFPW